VTVLSKEDGHKEVDITEEQEDDHNEEEDEHKHNEEEDEDDHNEEEEKEDGLLEAEEEDRKKDVLDEDVPGGRTRGELCGNKNITCLPITAASGRGRKRPSAPHAVGPTLHPRRPCRGNVRRKAQLS